MNTASYIKKTYSGLVSNNTIYSFHKILNKFLKIRYAEKKRMGKNALKCFNKYFNLVNSNNKMIILLKRNI